MEFVTTDLITWFILHWIYYILSNFAKFLRNEKAVEVYLIWLHNTKSSPPPGSLIKSCFFTGICPWMCAALRVSERKFIIEEIQKLALRWCGSLIVLPLFLEEGQTYNCLLGFMLLWFSSGFESDFDSTKMHLCFLPPPSSNSNNCGWELCQTFWHPLKHLIIEFYWLARRKVGSEGQA